jgi:histidine triad (HIT) family protein
MRRAAARRAGRATADGQRTSGEDTVQDCVFCRIARGELPSRKVYEDDEVLAFHDIHPVAPVHFMLIPKRHIGSLADATPEDAPVLGRMMALAPRLARESGSPEGFRTIVNTGRIGRQDVMHLHIHVIGGPDPLGPMIVRGRT